MTLDRSRWMRNHAVPGRRSVAAVTGTSGTSSPHGSGEQRQVVDYALARRALLADVYAGRVSTAEVCDAHPYLLRAARFHGSPTATRCPVCRRADLTEVSYVYGDTLGAASGRAVRPTEVESLAGRHGEVAVYVVEVCQYCSWNQLVTTYRTGCAPARRRRSAGSGSGR